LPTAPGDTSAARAAGNEAQTSRLAALQWLAVDRPDAPVSGIALPDADRCDLIWQTGFQVHVPKPLDLPGIHGECCGERLMPSTEPFLSLGHNWNLRGGAFAAPLRRRFAATLVCQLVCQRRGFGR